MKRRNLVLAALLARPISGFAQTQKFDVMTFTPPRSWKQGQSGSAKTFTSVDAASGKFCVMSLYPSITNHGTPAQDFAYVWKTLLQSPFNVGAAATTEVAESGGFTLTSASQLIDFQGNKALALLTTVSGKGRVISLLSILNDQKYAADVQAFLSKIDIDIKESVTAAQKPAAVPTSAGKPSVSSNDILGEWYLSDGTVKIALWFAANGRYKRSYTANAVKPIALNLYQTTTFEGDGAYSVSGVTLKLLPKRGEPETHQFRVTLEKSSDGKLEKKLYLVRPVEGGKLYESEFWFVN